MSVTRDEILAAITAACVPVLPVSDPGYTTQELAEAWSCGLPEARKRINAALRAGKLVKGKRWRVDAANRTVPMTVYRAA